MSICGRTATWLKSSNTISIGSSMVTMFTSGLRQVLEHRVQRGGLAAAGGPGDEDDPGRPRDEVVELRHVAPGEPELVDPLQQDVGVEDAQHRLLAEGGGHGGDAQLDLAPALLALDAAVLRPALLGEVAARRAA